MIQAREMTTKSLPRRIESSPVESDGETQIDERGNDFVKRKKKEK